jgi:protoheme IX farnesyltransferase
MDGSQLSSPLATSFEPVRVSARARFADYVQLTRPRIALMVLITTLLGALLAGGPTLTGKVLLLTVIGTGLVASGASIFNQLIERSYDARMLRTENRPLPSGRLGATEVAVFGSATTVAGIVCLATLPTGLLAAMLAGVTMILYVSLYTPAKRHTWWNTWIGAVPGALPPLIGWAGATGSLSWSAWPLFAVLFFWQIPHFLAIAWMHREDYRRAGLQMLPVLDRAGLHTSVQMIVHTIALIAVSLAPLAYGAGIGYAVGAVAFGIAFLVSVLRFSRLRVDESARHVLRWSIVYLPAVLIWLAVDRYW